MVNGNKWTANDIPDLSGKVIIVTGANTGLGYEATKEFARKDAETILACRNLEKGTKALEKIKKKIPDAKAEVRDLDLGSLNSIREFSEKFKSEYSRLDVLLNNAGIMFTPYRQTENGFESQVGVNHLGHFALTNQLFELISSTAGARIVNVSSSGHRMGEMDFDNFMFEDGNYSRRRAYGRSKLANLLFTYELDRRLKKANIDVIAAAAHPGSSKTDLGRAIPGYRVLTVLLGWMIPSAAQGALPEIRAAVDPNVQGGEYYGPDGWREQRGHPVLVKSSEASYNKKDAEKLWKISEKLTGTKFSINRI
jgi:NAD(P)-dependent dehydrogenase (short-subunit alcohol dehydrogenase family)